MYIWHPGSPPGIFAHTYVDNFVLRSTIRGGYRHDLPAATPESPTYATVAKKDGIILPLPLDVHILRGRRGIPRPGLLGYIGHRTMTSSSCLTWVLLFSGAAILICFFHLSRNCVRLLFLSRFSWSVFGCYDFCLLFCMVRIRLLLLLLFLWSCSCEN